LEIVNVPAAMLKWFMDIYTYRDVHLMKDEDSSSEGCRLANTDTDCWEGRSKLLCMSFERL